MEKVNLSLSSDVENSLILHHDVEEEFPEQKLNGLLKQLKLCQRICLEKMYYQNKSYKVISRETGYSEKQVKSYIQNGKRNLRIYILNNKELIVVIAFIIF